MINLNFDNSLKSIKIVVFETNINAVFSIKYTSGLILKIFLFEAITIPIFPVLLYLQNGKLDFHEAAIPTVFSLIFLFFIINQKKYLTIYPYKNKAKTKQSFSPEVDIKWPTDSVLSYEINYSGEGDIINVLLLAKSDHKKTIPIFAFPDMNTFELFRSEYNSQFPSNLIDIISPQ
jgi:hypothetical protein